MTETKVDPKQHDEATAELYFDLEKAEQELRVAQSRIIRSVGPKETLWGNESKQGWGKEEIFHDFDYAITHCTDEDLVSAWETVDIRCHTLTSRIDGMEAQYTGWSRFFLVVSSQGHIHSSMYCSTCYNTTRYGWLPELSGREEVDTIELCGPVLCSVCFPSAPVAWQGGKVRKKEAARLAWSPDRDEKIAKEVADRAEKAAKRAKKEASKLKYDENLAHKVNFLVDKFGDDESAEYKWTWSNKGYDNAHFAHSDMLRKRRVTA